MRLIQLLISSYNGGIVMYKQELIEKFISQISEKYPLIHIDYDYDSEDDEYVIWHNNSDLEFNSDSFAKYVGEKAEELLFKNKIFNFSIGYDYDKSLELNNEEITFRNSKIGEVFAEYVDGLLTEYTININFDYEFNNSIDGIEMSSKHEEFLFKEYTVFNMEQIDSGKVGKVFNDKTIFEEAA